MRRLLILLIFATASLFANYQSKYIPDQVKKDFSEGAVGKYQVETIPTVTLAELKSKGVYGANGTLVKHVSGTPNFKAIVAADVCKVDAHQAYTSTIYEMDLPNGVITCMYAAKGDLYNPMGLYKVSVPEVKAYYGVDTEAAKTEKAAEIANAEKQFAPLLEKKKQISSKAQKEGSAGFLTIPELLLAAVLTDDEIIDIEATRATGKFQLKSGYTSKFTNSDKIVDNTEYLLTDAATIFDVYTGLGGVSMTYLMILVVGFGAYGGIRFFGGAINEKIEDKSGKDKKIPFLVGITAGVLLFFPQNSININKAAGEVTEYELLKTRYQGFEKFGYYTFAEWANESAKVIIDAETETLIRKSGLGTKEQIVDTTAQITQSQKLNAFYVDNYNTCLKDIYKQENLALYDGKSIFGETDKSTFPSTEHWAYAAYKGRTLTNGYYETGDEGSLKDGVAGVGEYPKFAFSACGKADYLSNFHKEKKDQLVISYDTLVATSGGDAGATKHKILGEIFDFQYGLYRDWGFLAVLALPVTKMQTEYIGGLYKTTENEVMKELHKKNGTDTVMHSILSSIPYMFVPGAGTVFQVANENSGKLGAAVGGVVAGGATAGLGGIFGAAIGGLVGTATGGLIGMSIAYAVAKAVLALAPIIAILAIGLLRFIIIILKIFSFHFLSLFMMPIMFLKENVRGIATFSVKIVATMLEIPVFVLSIWLAVTANSLIHTIGNVFSKEIIGGMLANNNVGFEGVDGIMGIDGEMLGMLRIYVFDGFMEVVIAVFSIVIVYKIIVTLHTSLFEMFDMQTSHALDNSIESMKSESSGWGTRI